MDSPKKYTNILVGVSLFLVFLQPFLAMKNFSPAFDENSHLPSGYSYLKTGEIKLNPQHPPLIKILSALPLLFFDLKFDADDPNLAGPKTDEWQFGRDFLFNNGIDRVIFWGRIPMVLLSVLLGWYVFKWGKDLFGRKAGVVGLFIYALMPNIIAQAQLVTTDLGVAAFSFIALYYLWKITQSCTKRNIILSGLVLGLALGSKFSAIFLLPIIFVLLAVYVQKNYSRSSWGSRAKLFLKIFTPILGLAILVIWVLYFFPKDPLFYWKGLQTVYADRSPSYFYYLNGVFRHEGWWYYFLEAFVIKTPVPFLAVLGWALFRYKKLALSFLNASFIFLPVVLFLFLAGWKAQNIGVRYILIIYPFLILYAGGFLGRLDFRFAKNTFAAAVIVALGLWYVFSSGNVYPDYLAYFNELVGGSENGYKYLDDSNLEWGQDLKRLSEYQKKNPDLKVFLWTDFNAERAYGIKNILALTEKDEWQKPSGKYAVSAHVVARTGFIAQVYKNQAFNWADNYKPTDRIGQSFFIYEF